MSVLPGGLFIRSSFNMTEKLLTGILIHNTNKQIIS